MEKSPIDDRDLLSKNIYNLKLKVPKKLDLRKDMNKIRNQEILHYVEHFLEHL